MVRPGGVYQHDVRPLKFWWISRLLARTPARTRTATL